MTSIRARSPHPPEEATTPPILTDNEEKSVRKSLEVVNGDSESIQPIDIPATAVSASTPAMRRKARIQFITLCWTLFLAGWNDGTTGPLLPRIQIVYHGFLTAAATNVWLTDRLGFGKVMVLGSSAQVVGYCLESPAPPFPVFVLGYTINGFGMGLQDAGANGFVASLKDNATTKMGILHAIYGVGALVSPLIATQFAQLHQWSFHYLTSLGVALANTIALIVVFRFKTQDGWIVTYVINLRGGGPSSGYISSGFFGGLTLGRVGLLWVTQKVGERRAIFMYAIVAIGLELIIWLVPSLIGGAVAVSFVGVLLGPIYPIVMNHASRVLPPKLLNGSIGWIAGFGQAGSALLPFLTGALASRVGIKSLQPLYVPN
uniref:Major facilitator superfamily transporter n=1 Tax=Ganoderma boninense TaxID=34458 RepID=A0A5K1JW87_9APHY|nr:Major facilitator superfamily transporter [Ganoderma boninense]